MDLGHALELQGGVVSRRQALAAGMQDHDIRRMLRRREWVRVHAGVYVDHTGPLSWLQRAWAAVLYAEPAALCLESALGVETTVIHVAISRERSAPVAPKGVRIHRIAP
ncbi:type IV toxin-antitoxin system AbiEi family antitoxin domain-containing protein [Mycolicibacterium thermoresistibile]